MVLLLADALPYVSAAAAMCATRGHQHSISRRSHRGRSSCRRLRRRRLYDKNSDSRSSDTVEVEVVAEKRSIDAPMAKRELNWRPTSPGPRTTTTMASSLRLPPPPTTTAAAAATTTTTTTFCFFYSSTALNLKT